MREVAVEPPEEDHGNQGDGDEFDPALPRQQVEQGGDQDDAPSLHPERVGDEAVDDTLDEFQLFDFPVYLHPSVYRCRPGARIGRRIMLPTVVQCSHRVNPIEARVRLRREHHVLRILHSWSMKKMKLPYFFIRQLPSCRTALH